MPKECLKCGQVGNAASPLECPHCGAVYSKLEALANTGALIRPTKVPTQAEREAAREALARQPAERLAAARESGNWSLIDPAVVADETSRVVLVTTDTVPGKTIERACAVVAADYAFAFGAIGEEIAGAFRNLVGSGPSPETVAQLQKGRAAVLDGLRPRALAAGANAVVGIRIELEEISGANQRGILILSATGTAVRLAG